MSEKCPLLVCYMGCSWQRAQRMLGVEIEFRAAPERSAARSTKEQEYGTDKGQRNQLERKLSATPRPGQENGSPVEGSELVGTGRGCGLGYRAGEHAQGSGICPEGRAR